MKILSIGNSFSEDAQRYLAAVGHSLGLEIKCVNACIGGCTLVRHYNNIRSGARDYLVQECGTNVREGATLREIILSDSFDVITLQEASVRSVDYHNFEPYLSELVKYIRDLCPDAKIALHETWGYESESERIKNLGYTAHEDMYASIKEAYAKAMSESGADFLIPSGRVMAMLYGEGLKIHRDGFHASRGVGRYALALTWVRAICGVSVEDNDFYDFEEEITDEERRAVISAVESIYKNTEVN